MMRFHLCGRLIATDAAEDITRFTPGYPPSAPMCYLFLRFDLIPSPQQPHGVRLYLYLCLHPFVMLAEAPFQVSRQGSSRML
jgi:hypothetical protein